MCQKQPLEVFYYKSDLKNITKFTEKVLNGSLLLNEIVGLWHAA